MKLLMKLRPVNASPLVRFTPLIDGQNPVRRTPIRKRNLQQAWHARCPYPVGLHARSGKQMMKITRDGEIAEIVRVSLSGHFTSDYIPEVEKALVQNGKRSKKRALD